MNYLLQQAMEINRSLNDLNREMYFEIVHSKEEEEKMLQKHLPEDCLTILRLYDEED